MSRPTALRVFPGLHGLSGAQRETLLVLREHGELGAVVDVELVGAIAYVTDRSTRCSWRIEPDGHAIGGGLAVAVAGEVLERGLRSELESYTPPS